MIYILVYALHIILGMYNILANISVSTYIINVLTFEYLIIRSGAGMLLDIFGKW